MIRYAMSHGVGGFFVDGSICDTRAIKDVNFPVYARGVSPMGTYNNGSGEINVPVCCGGAKAKTNTLEYL